MKNSILFMAFLFLFQMAQAQQWLTNGNSATSAVFIGTTNPTHLFDICNVEPISVVL